MKIYRIEIITSEKGLQENEEDFIDERICIDLQHIDGKVNTYNKVQEEILKLFFPHENRNKQER